MQDFARSGAVAGYSIRFERCPKVKSRRQGFTLIETAIATGILVIAAAAIATLFVNSLRLGIENREKTNANAVLVNKLEELRMAPPPSGDYSDVVVLPDGTSLLREWRVTGTAQRDITIIVYSGRHVELIRTATTRSMSW